jgi:hypothetical protein
MTTLLGLGIVLFITWQTYKSDPDSLWKPVIVGIIATVVVGLVLTGNPMGLTSDCYGNGLRESAGC